MIGYLFKLQIFAQNADVREASEETEHDEVSVGPVNHVRPFGVEVGAEFEVTDEREELVLTFTWHVAAREDDFQFGVLGVLNVFALDEKPDLAISGLWRVITIHA